MVTAQHFCVRVCSQALKTTTDDVISDHCESDTCPLPHSARRAGSNTPETIHVPYFVDLRPTGIQFTSATDYFTKNCLPLPPPPPAAAAMSASAADVSTRRLVQSKMVAPVGQSIRGQIPSNLPPQLQHLNVLKRGRRGRRMKRLGSRSDYIKASRTIQAFFYFYFL